MSKRKGVILEMLQLGPVTVGDVRANCNCTSAAQAISSMKWIEDCGVVRRSRVPRDNSKGGPSMTTQWEIAA
ncbi:hypothetical protein CSC73_16195 [Pseudoxanthomonas sacheonensis]|nr:hypothetical protein CSC73_16195 [Pseudoxanthomonas sacheonensis]